jgi:methanogenic corrinoid protein MtbC1
VHSDTTSIGANVTVLSNGRILRSTSSLKYKTDVRDYDKGLNEVMQLQPKYYKGKNDESETQFAGLIAEDVHDLGLSEFVQYADDGSPDALSYTHMIALLTKGIQELKAEIETLKAQIN